MVQSERYYVPHGSYWPIVGAVGLFFMMLGTSLWLNGIGVAGWVAWAGIAVVLVMICGWFATVINESEGGVYNTQVDRSFRMGMTWFIISEVMFFAAFFGALFYARQLAIPWLGGAGNNFFTHFLLYPDFEAAWPTSGPEAWGGELKTIPAFGLPALNTAILLTSGVTITIAHHALKDGNRRLTAWGLFATIALGALFLCIQAYEYVHAYLDLELRLSSGIYGSTFFMLTGFHGLHVTLGAIMLTVIWIRVLKGHFTPTQHFGFEGVAWYWHFVDVVWLGLYIFVYWL
jgi:cytochrome c oxidase subunit III